MNRAYFGLEPGTRLNDMFEIKARIAHGGIGTVYRAHEIETSGLVAIKVLNPEFASDQHMLNLFRKEALILRDLHHEALARSYIFAKDPSFDLNYLAMEFIEGPPLSNKLLDGALTAEVTSDLLRRIASGLHVAHQKGIVHRDVSPDNILLPAENVRNAKIIDFGIARSNSHGTTIIGRSFAGKEQYASPEQFGLFDVPASPVSDIYSLGLVIYHALTGRRLEMGNTHVELVDKRMRLPDLTGVDVSFVPLLTSMLQPNPADRLESMEKLLSWSLPKQDKTIVRRRDKTAMAVSNRVANDDFDRPAAFTDQSEDADSASKGNTPPDENLKAIQTKGVIERGRRVVDERRLFVQVFGALVVIIVIAALYFVYRPEAPFSEVQISGPPVTEVPVADPPLADNEQEVEVEIVDQVIENPNDDFESVQVPEAAGKEPVVPVNPTGKPLYVASTSFEHSLYVAELGPFKSRYYVEDSLKNALRFYLAENDVKYEALEVLSVKGGYLLAAGLASSFDLSEFCNSKLPTSRKDRCHIFPLTASSLVEMPSSSSEGSLNLSNKRASIDLTSFKNFDFVAELGPFNNYFYVENSLKTAFRKYLVNNDVRYEALLVHKVDGGYVLTATLADRIDISTFCTSALSSENRKRCGVLPRVAARKKISNASKESGSLTEFDSMIAQKISKEYIGDYKIYVGPLPQKVNGKLELVKKLEEFIMGKNAGIANIVIDQVLDANYLRAEVSKEVNIKEFCSNVSGDFKLTACSVYKFDTRKYRLNTGSSTANKNGAPVSERSKKPFQNKKPKWITLSSIGRNFKTIAYLKSAKWRDNIQAEYADLVKNTGNTVDFGEINFIEDDVTGSGTFYLGVLFESKRRSRKYCADIAQAVHMGCSLEPIKR